MTAAVRVRAAHSGRRQCANEVPWSRAVLRALELNEYRRLPRHVPGLIARKLGIAAREEQRCLELLERAKQIYRDQGRFHVGEARTVDTRSDPARSREPRAFWAQVATESSGPNSPSTSS